MNNFSNKSQNEKVTLTWDFTDELAGDTIVSIVATSCTVTKGTDAGAAAMLLGSPAISTDAHSVSQSCNAGVDGNNYRLTCRVQTASEILELAGTLRVRSAT